MNHSISVVKPPYLIIGSVLSNGSPLLSLTAPPTMADIRLPGALPAGKGGVDEEKLSESQTKQPVIVYMDDVEAAYDLWSEV